MNKVSIFSQIKSIEERNQVELESLNIDSFNDFDQYSPSNKRCYIVDNDEALVALALDGVKDLDISDVCKFTSVKKLSIRDTSLDSDALHKLANHLTTLISLDLSGTKVTNLSFIKSLPDLKSLYLRNCKNLSVSSLNELTSLNLLDIGNNNLVDIGKLEKLKKLQTLRINNAGLVEWPQLLDNLTSLINLDLSVNELTHIPPGICKIKSLQTLKLSKNNLTGLPDEIGQLNNLEELYLRGNNISVFPHPILLINNITLLDLNSNKLIQVPPEISKLSLLKKLDFSQNKLSSLPHEMYKLTSLNLLDIGNNNLVDIGKLEKLKKLQTLRINNTGLVEWPQLLDNLTSLINLDLSANELTHIPPGICKMKSLQTLKLSNNDLTGLPDEIGQLNNLEELYLRGNNISVFPQPILLINNITLLDLNSNKLIQVPPEISKLSLLKKLDFSQNKLSSLPYEMYKLTSLTLLDCAANSLASIPEPIFTLKLQLFSEGYFFDWEREGFCLHNNPLESPPIEIVHKGIGAVHEYFKLLDDNKKSNNEVKVLLVGDGGAGKTSLVKSLIGEAFLINEPSTHGINIKDWKVNNSKRDFLVHFWDFGGQEIMHATHQFFLSKRSLYVLVLDGRKEEKIEYWLKHIESFGGDSPILVVLNKLDETPSFDVNRKFILNKYKGVKGFFPLSCAEGTGVEEFSSNLCREIGNVEILETMWPERWFNVKVKLEELRAPYLSYEDFKEICLQEAICETFSQETLTGFLHDLGVFLHFGDHNLEDVHVLDPKWVTHAVYKIINSPEVARNGGILGVSLLPSLLKKMSKDDFKYTSNDRRYILSLMKKFELSYSINSNELLIPDLLEVQEPDFEFDYESSLKCIIEYDFLPKSVIPRFIVQMHMDIYKDLRWRTGVLLRNEAFNAIALVRADNESKKIYIYVSGAQKKDYFAVILYVFRGINRKFEKLVFSEGVPMPDNENVTVSYAHLIRLAMKGFETYMPDGAEHEYDVSELLGLIQLPSQAHDQIMQVLREIKGKFENKKTLSEEVNNIIDLKPNLFGIGVDINELLNKLFHEE